MNENELIEAVKETKNLSESVIEEIKQDNVYEKYKQNPESLDKEEALAVIKFLEHKVVLLEKNAEAAYSKTREVLTKHNQQLAEINSNIRALREKLRVDYRTTLLTLDQLEKEVYSYGY